MKTQTPPRRGSRASSPSSNGGNGAPARKPRGIRKSPSGIQGLDEITHGGLPTGRTTLVCGSAGCGKTLFATEFLVRGATTYNEPGVFMAFEETPDELIQNVRSLGFALDELTEDKKVVVDYVRVEKSEIEETGSYDLDGLFIRLNHAIDSISAKRVVLDTLEVLFSGLTDTSILRAELRRLFRWLKDKGVTAIVTGERGEGMLTRHGLEEYISDCVILLDHRVRDQISTRRLRVVKYRGTFHGTDEYPFLIDEDGISVLPVTSLSLAHQVSAERVASGLPELDEMLGGQGYYRGSTVLVSGTAGTGKTSLAAYFADACCRRGERVVYLSFEESPTQMIRNMRSIGLHLDPWVRKGLLRMQATRASQYGLEMHLAAIHKLVRDVGPQAIIMDPIDSLMHTGSQQDAVSVMTRVIDFLKQRQITAFLVNLTAGGGEREATDLEISSIVDTWLLLRDVEASGERNRIMYVLKSRGMAHSNQLREFVVTSQGIRLVEAYLGPEGVLTGSMRLSQIAREESAALVLKQETEAKQRALDRKREALEARIKAMRLDFEHEAGESELLISQDRDRANLRLQQREAMAKSRHARTNGKSARSVKPETTRSRP